MHQEDELDFDEDDLVPQAFAIPSSSSSSSLQSRSQPHPAVPTAPLTATTIKASTPASTKPPPHDTSLDSLGRKLPQGWVSRMSNTTGELYYRNTVSNTSSWEIPTTPAVEIKNDSPPPPSSLPQTAPPASQPFAQHQQPSQQAQTTETRTGREVDQSLPKGPKSATHLDRAKLVQSIPSGSSSAAAVLPTGPRASTQTSSNPPRQPTASTAAARYLPRATPSSTTIPAASQPQKLETSNESSKPSTSSSITSNELPRGPRASTDQQRRQSIPSQPSAVQSSTTRSSRDPPSGPAPRNPNPARSVNSIPVAPRNPSAPTTASASTDSTHTSRSIVDERRSSVASARSNGESSRGTAVNRPDRDSTNPRALSVVTSLPRGPRHGPRHSAPILPPSKPLATADSKRNGDSSEQRRSSISNGSSSRIVEEERRSRPSPLAREDSSSRPRSRDTSPRAPQDRESRAGAGGRKEETSSRRVEDLDRSLDDYNRGREGRDSEKGDRRERERSPVRKEETRRERSRSRDRYAKASEKRRLDEGKERDSRRGERDEYVDKMDIDSLSSSRSRPLHDDSTASKRDLPPHVALQRVPSSSTADSHRPRSLRELSKSPPIAPSPAQRQKMRDEARKEQQRGVSIEIGGGGTRGERSRREGSRPDKDAGRSRDSDRSDRERAARAAEVEKEKERVRLRAIDDARNRERDMVERERARGSYRDDRRDRDEDRYCDRGRDRREVSPPLLRFASSTTPFLPPPSPPRASRTRTRSLSPPIPRPPVSSVAPSTSSRGGGGGGRGAIHIEIGGNAIVKTPASFRGKHRVPDREEILGHSIVPLMRIVGTGSNGLDDLDARERRRERSPPLASYRGERSRDARGGSRYARSRSPVRERSPVRSRARSPVRESINRSSDLSSALPPRPTASSPKSTTPSLLSRMSGLPERPVSASPAIKDRPSSINGAAKRIRDPEEVIREAEMKKRRG